MVTLYVYLTQDKDAFVEQAVASEKDVTVLTKSVEMWFPQSDGSLVKGFGTEYAAHMRSTHREGIGFTERVPCGYEGRTVLGMLKERLPPGLLTIKHGTNKK